MYCPNCYRINDDENIFCVKCGHPLHAETEKTPQITEAPKANRCMYCGKELSSNLQHTFCPYCGHQVDGANNNESPSSTHTAVPSTKYCSHCGGIVRPEAVICIHCGCAISNTSQTVNTQNKVDDIKNNEDDEPDGCAGCLCFLFPPLGLIAYIMLVGSKPNSAKNALKMAGVGLLFSFIGSLFLMLLG